MQYAPMPSSKKPIQQPPSNRDVVRIEQAPQQAKLSAAQKKFNTLTKNIDAQKKLLADWQATLSWCQQDVAGKLLPLQQVFSGHQADMVLLFDHLYKSERFTRQQKEKLSYLIEEMASELVSVHGREDMKPLYNEYSGGDFDAELEEEEAIQKEMMRNMVEQEFGISLDEEDLSANDPDKLAERLFNKYQERQQAEAQARPQRKKSAKQQAKEAKEQEEAENASKSIRTVYRQLVAALHPDREQDPVERERKTELMQQVTVAYDKQDLLQLLELQLSVEQIDQSKLNNLAEDRLKYYNKILQNQLQELQDEVLMLTERMRRMANLPPFQPLSPQRLALKLKQDIRSIESEIDRIQQDLRRFRDVRELKVWLKAYQIPDDTFDFFDIMPPFPDR